VIMSSQFEYTVTPKGVRVEKSTHWLDFIRHYSSKTTNLVRLELKQLGFGLYFGNLWLILEPLLQAGTYYFLLTVVFRISGADTSFAFFFVPVTFWRSHAMLVSSAPYFMSSKGHPYVEQGFGLLTAYLEVTANELMLMGIRVAVLCAFLLIAGYSPQWTWLLVPLIAAVQMLFTMALHIWLSMFGVAFKDYGKLVSHVVWLWWYLSPGLYSIGRIPDWAQAIYYANPFAHIIPAYHAVMLEGTFSPYLLLANALIAAGSVGLIWLGAKRLRIVGYQMAQYL
jgi:ABC-type polysaccharide/polyol phosphate export permease